MSNIPLFIALGLTGVSQVTQGLADLTRNGLRSASQFSSGWQAAGRRIASIGGDLLKASNMVGGAGLAWQTIKDVAEFERGLTEMRLTGELTAKEMNDIRQQILALSKTDLQLPEDQLAAFQQMVAAGIDPRVAIRGMHAINQTATATFANVRDIAGTSIDLLQKMNISPEKLGRSFNMMSKAGKLGPFKLKNMAQEIPSVLAAASPYGITGERGVAQISAMLQIARHHRSTGSEAATDMRSFFGHITTYRQQFKKIGFNMSDYIDVRQGGKFKPGKDIDMFFEDLKKKSFGGSETALKAIGIQDHGAANFMAGLMQDWNDYKKMRDQILASADQPVVADDSQKVKETTWGKLKEGQITKSVAMKSERASGVAATAAGGVKWAADNPVAAAGLLAGGYVAVRKVRSWIGGRMGGPIGAAGGLAGGGMPLPVYVVNKHLSMLPGQGWGFPGSKPGGMPALKKAMGAIGTAWQLAKNPLTKGSVLAGLGARAGWVGLAAAGGYAVGTGINYGLDFATRTMTGGKSDHLADVVYDMLHPQQPPANGTAMMAAQTTTAASRTAAELQPGPRQQPGQTLGSGGLPLAARLAGLPDSRLASTAAVKNDIKIDIQIDGSGRAFVQTADPNTTTSVNRGAFFNALMTTGGA